MDGLLPSQLATATASLELANVKRAIEANSVNRKVLHQSIN